MRRNGLGLGQIQCLPVTHSIRTKSDLLEGMMNAIVGVRTNSPWIERTATLSQNRSEQGHARIISKVRERGDPDSLSMARAMEKHAAPA